MQGAAILSFFRHHAGRLETKQARRADWCSWPGIHEKENGCILAGHYSAYYFCYAFFSSSGCCFVAGISACAGFDSSWQPIRRMTFSRRRLLYSLPGLALAPWLSACKRAPIRPLSIASHVWPGYELMFLAREEGWLPTPDLRLLETATATASLAALADNRADGAALTLDEVLRARADGIALNVVLVFDVSTGADMLLARPEIQSLADLAGKRIGVEQSALGALMLHKILAAAGLSKSAVTLVPMNADGHMDTWRRERLDALITYEPTASRLLAEGARRLYDSREMPDTIFDVLAIKPDAVARQPKALAALVAGHFRALQHLRHNPQDAAHRMATRMAIPAGEVRDAYRGLELPDIHANRHLLADGENHLLKAARELSQVMLAAGLLARTADLTELTLNDFLPTAN